MFQGWLGITLIIVSFFIPVLFQNKTGGKYAKWSLLFIFIHQIFSVINAFFFNFDPLSADANHFNNDAIKLANQHLSSFSWSGAIIYPHILSYIYLLDPFILTGQGISVIIYSLTIVLLYDFIKLLELNDYAILILIAFSFNPMDILHNVGVVRESWERLSFMLVCFYSVKSIMYERLVIKELLWMTLFSFVASVLHTALFAAVIFVWIITFAYHGIAPKRKVIHFSFRIILYLFFGVIAYLLFLYVQIIYPDLFKEAILYTTNIPDANTTYEVSVSDGSITSMISAFLYYMLYPFPWLISNITDLYACGIALLRIVLLIGAYIQILNAKSLTYQRVCKIIIFYVLFIAFLFSIGTNNYGTAMRHQILTFWGLALVGVPGVIKWLKKHV